MGSADVSVLDSPAAVTAFAEQYAERLDEFEVEEFITGKLCFVDAVVADGTVVAAMASRYLESTLSYLDDQPRRALRAVSLAPGPELDRLLEFNQRVLNCHPGFTGAIHHEMFVTDGGVCFCEIGARAGGGGVMASFRSRTGVNLDEAVLRGQVTGTLPPVSEVIPHQTGWVILYAEPGRLAEPWVLEAQIMAQPGEELADPVNANAGVAIVTVRGDTETEVTERLAEVIRAGTPRVTPADAAQPA
jgi:hypothetical protein